jgi:hypothetical protein
MLAKAGSAGGISLVAEEALVHQDAKATRKNKRIELRVKARVSN